jgi:hypothetical protein
MTFLEGVGVAAAVYLLLLARSAWKQGEIRQFLWSLGVVAAIGAVISLAIAAAALLDGR